MKCKKCGRDNEKGQKFCGYCGSVLKKKSMRPWLAIICVLLCVTALVCVVKPMAEKKIIEECIAHFIGEIQEGYISELDYNIPEQLYTCVTDGWNPTVKTVFEVTLGGQETWEKGWKTIMQDMSYEILAIEKDENGDFVIDISFSNKNTASVLVKTTEGIVDSKFDFVVGALAGTVGDQFWEDFGKYKQEETDMVSEEYRIILTKEDGEWTVDTDSIEIQMFGTIAGFDDQYLELILSE